MTRTFLYILTTGAIGAFTLASACTVTSTDDDDTIVGAGGTTTATTNNTTTSTGGSGAQGGAGVGGGTECASCGDVWTGAEPFENICGLMGETCVDNSSCALIQAIGSCICEPASGCVDEQGAGACAQACDPNDGLVTEQCQDCANAGCNAEVGECTSDPGAN